MMVIDVHYSDTLKLALQEAGGDGSMIKEAETTKRGRSGVMARMNYLSVCNARRATDDSVYGSTRHG